MATTDWRTLVSAEQLHAELANPKLVICDCKVDHAQAIPGSIAIDREHDLSQPKTRSVVGQGRHPWPDSELFAQRLGQWGITPDTQVVVYDESHGAFAARLWYMLRLMGHVKVAVLEGGWERWMRLGYPTVEAADEIASQPATASYPGAFDLSRLASAEDVIHQLNAHEVVLDARAMERYEGIVEPLDVKAGHIPGAKNRPFMHNLQEGKFKERLRLKQEFEAELDGQQAEDAIVMCGSGITACHHLLAMEHAGLPAARLYTGSWSGWIENPEHPIGLGKAP